jgi:hypothetical protein
MKGASGELEVTAEQLMIVRSNTGITKLWTVNLGKPGASGLIPGATDIHSSLAAIIVLPASAGFALLYAVFVVFSKM